MTILLAVLLVVSVVVTALALREPRFTEKDFCRVECVSEQARPSKHE